MDFLNELIAVHGPIPVIVGAALIALMIYSIIKGKGGKGNSGSSNASSSGGSKPSAPPPPPAPPTGAQ